MARGLWTLLFNSLEDRLLHLTFLGNTKHLSKLTRRQALTLLCMLPIFLSLCWTHTHKKEESRLSKMSIISRRLDRRCRYCFAIVLLCAIFSILTSQWFVYRPSSDHFVEFSACPRCFGAHLCPVFATDHVQLSGRQRWKVMLSRLDVNY